jgi:hypothetical protein
MADIKINELIAEAVTNAVERRNQAIDSEASLSDLSGEELGKVTGGLACSPATMGIISKPPIIIGIIFQSPELF